MKSHFSMLPQTLQSKTIEFRSEDLPLRGEYLKVIADGCVMRVVASATPPWYISVFALAAVAVLSCLIHFTVQYGIGSSSPLWKILYLGPLIPAVFIIVRWLSPLRRDDATIFCYDRLTQRVEVFGPRSQRIGSPSSVVFDNVPTLLCVWEDGLSIDRELSQLPFQVNVAVSGCLRISAVQDEAEHTPICEIVFRKGLPDWSRQRAFCELINSAVANIALRPKA